MKPRKSIFTLAAEKQHTSMLADEFGAYMIQYPYVGTEVSRYACDNIGYAVGEVDGMFPVRYKSQSPEKDFFTENFRPHDHEEKNEFGTTYWWPELKGEIWDYESRILALLLCAEMLRK